MTTAKWALALSCLTVAAAALPGSAKDQATVALGQTSAQVRAVLGEPEWTWSLGARQVLGFEEMKVALVNDKVTEIHIWLSCEAQGRAGEAGCRLPDGHRLVQTIPRP